MTSATFKSLYGNDTKRLKLPQIRKKSKQKRFVLFHCFIGHYWRASGAGLKLSGREIEVYIFHQLLNV